MEKDISARKSDHIHLAFDAQAPGHDPRFDYEPVLKGHPLPGSVPALQVAGRVLRMPVWISSMTGGAAHAGAINRNLANACREFGMAMGLGSCRPVLEDASHLKDFAVRPFIGDQPLFANLGIAQLEELIYTGKQDKIAELVKQLEADGLIVHINPLQEWLQPEGDRFLHPPLETIKRLLDFFKLPVIVKEVGQGMGPESLKQLAALPLEAIDFGAQGGTNFALLETLRRDEFYQKHFGPVAHLGHTAAEMTEMVREILSDPDSDVLTRSFIVSGGIRNFLDGYYHIQRIPAKAMYAQASVFLKHALEGEDKLFQYCESQMHGLEMAFNYLKIRE